MAGRKDFVLRGAGIVAVAGVLAGGGTYVIGGGGGGELTANLWVDTTTSGNTCVDHASLTAYATNDACNSFDAAWDAAEAGDVIGVAAGSYGSQVVSGDKASETRIVGVDQATVIFSDGEALGDHMTLEDMTINSGATHGWTYRIGSASVAADNVTFRDVVMRGQYVTLEQFDGDNFTWDGGSLGAEGDTVGLRCNLDGDHEPIEFNGNSGHHLTHLTIWPQGGQEAPPCSGDGFHEEDVRIQSDNTTIENVVFKDGSAVNRNGGSGKIFLSGTTTGIVIRNVIFGPVHTSSNNAMDANVTSCSLTIAYSTFTTEGTALDLCTSVTLIHNLGPNAPGVPTTGILSAGNAAIDAAAATCAADTGGVDFEGTVRPQGSACDKGADEYTP